MPRSLRHVMMLMTGRDRAGHPHASHRSFSSDDRRGVEQLYRRTFGAHAADAIRLRWDWKRRNPANSSGEPSYLIVREDPQSSPPVH